MSLTAEDEEDLWNDMQSIGEHARAAANMKRIGEMRQEVLKIYAITRHWKPTATPEAK
jgi:hypothetical protein